MEGRIWNISYQKCCTTIIYKNLILGQKRSCDKYLEKMAVFFFCSGLFSYQVLKDFKLVHLWGYYSKNLIHFGNEVVWYFFAIRSPRVSVLFTIFQIGLSA